MEWIPTSAIPLHTSMHQASLERIGLLRQRLQEAGAWDPKRHDDHALRRFLRARGGDIEAAMKMWLARSGSAPMSVLLQGKRECLWNHSDGVLRGLHRPCIPPLSLSWRDKMRADTIMDESIMSPEQRVKLIRLYPHGLHGVDVEGRPVLVYLLGGTDVQRLKAEFSEPLLRRHHVQV